LEIRLAKAIIKEVITYMDLLTLLSFKDLGIKVKRCQN